MKSDEVRSHGETIAIDEWFVNDDDNDGAGDVDDVNDVSGRWSDWIDCMFEACCSRSWCSGFLGWISAGTKVTDSVGAVTGIDTGGNNGDGVDGVDGVEDGVDGCECGRDNGNGIGEGKIEGIVVFDTRELNG